VRKYPYDPHSNWRPATWEHTGNWERELLFRQLTTSPVKQPVLGVGISTTSYGEVLAVCAAWIDERRAWRKAPDSKCPAGRYICVTSVHGTMTGVIRPTFKAVLNAADIATPDGMPLVWALRSFGVSGQQRVYGPDLMLALCEQAALSGHAIFLYGGHKESLRELCTRLLARFPALSIVGSYSPPFRSLTPSEDENVIKRITDTDADIVFVGLSTPKQENWMAQHRDRLAGVVMVGVGAAFDFHAGRVPQAPRWMQRSGLEWFFRLLMEPRRLWRRYLLLNLWFLPLWALQKLGILKYRS